jgi:hypothetical protein
MTSSTAASAMMSSLIAEGAFVAESLRFNNMTSIHVDYTSLDDMASATDFASAETPPPSLAVRDETLAQVEIAVQAAIFVLAITGNGLVLGLLVAMSRRKELGRMYTMIGHLSIADLFVAFFNLLPQVCEGIESFL